MKSSEFLRNLTEKNSSVKIPSYTFKGDFSPYEVACITFFCFHKTKDLNSLIFNQKQIYEDLFCITENKNLKQIRKALTDLPEKIPGLQIKPLTSSGFYEVNGLSCLTEKRPNLYTKISRSDLIKLSQWSDKNVLYTLLRFKIFGYLVSRFDINNNLPKPVKGLFTLQKTYKMAEDLGITKKTLSIALRDLQSVNLLSHDLVYISGKASCCVFYRSKNESSKGDYLNAKTSLRKVVHKIAKQTDSPQVYFVFSGQPEAYGINQA